MQTNNLFYFCGEKNSETPDRQIEIKFYYCFICQLPVGNIELNSVVQEMKESGAFGEEGIDIIKQNIKNLSEWKDLSELIPLKFKKNTKLKKSGLAGIFSASLELSREGLINIMQKNRFDKLLIKEKK